MKIKLDEGAKIPTRGYATDAGLDLYSRETVTIYPGGSHVFDTGVHIGFDPGTYGKVESKSGLNVNAGIVSCGGVIDSGYTGSIVVKLYNFGPKGHLFKAGDKIAQIVIQPCITPKLEIVSCLDETERGENGFGSSGA